MHQPLGAHAGSAALCAIIAARVSRLMAADSRFLDHQTETYKENAEDFEGCAIGTLV